MPRPYPYLAAATVTFAAGVLTTYVSAAPIAVPVAHPVVAGGARVAAPAPVTPPRATLPGNLVNTPTSTGPSFTPYSANLAAPTNVAPTVVQAATYGQAAMNVPGQPPYGETFVSNQTSMNQPGQADFYEGMPNPFLVQANEGIQPSQAYPHPVSPATGVPASATMAAGFGLTQGPNTVGFYSGFGPGQADWGFYNGFTTPR